MNQTSNEPPPSKEEIYRQLERLLSSPDFKASSQQSAFLKYVVDQTLVGNAGVIEDHTVANQVFGRGPEFDQSIDPVVSIHASLLRRALARYYLTAGKCDPIRIILSEDAYLPVFERQSYPDPG